MLRLCNEFYGKQNDYFFILEAVGKNKTGLGTYNDFSSQHTGNISSSLLYVGSFCMCCQLLIDFITIYTVFALSGCAPTALLNCTQCFVNKVDLQYRNSGCPSQTCSKPFFYQLFIRTTFVSLNSCYTLIDVKVTANFPQRQCVQLFFIYTENGLVLIQCLSTLCEHSLFYYKPHSHNCLFYV